MDRAEATMLISRSLLLGRGEWSPQLRRANDPKGQSLRSMGQAMAVFYSRSLKSFEGIESPSRRPGKHASQSGLSMNCSCLRALNDLASEQLENGWTKRRQSRRRDCALAGRVQNKKITENHGSWAHFFARNARF